jgi:hypothetical protein
VDVSFPCSTCVQSSWECTFKEQARKRGPPKGYIGNLENRLKKMEKLLETLSGTPNFDDDDADDDDDDVKEEEDEEEQQLQERKRPKKAHPSTKLRASPTEDIVINIPTPKMATVNEDNDRKSKLKVKEPKIARYIGSSSGLYLMSKTRDEETMRKSLLFKDEIGTYRFGAASDASDDMMVLRDQMASEQAGDEDREETKVSLDVLSYLVDS